MNRTQKLKVEARRDLRETPEEKSRWLSKVPSQSWGKSSRFLAPRPVFLPLSHTASLNCKPLAVWQSSKPGRQATWMARLLRGRGWGEGAKGWRILWFYRNLFASRSCGYQCGCPQRKNDWLTAQTKAEAISQREIQESRGFVRITNTLHQVETKNNSEEKPTIHKGPFILWAFLLHTHFTWWNVRTFAFISVGSFWFFHIQLAHFTTIQCSYFFAN